MTFNDLNDLNTNDVFVRVLRSQRTANNCWSCAL